MERFKSITIIFLLLAVGLLVSAAQAKPASVLLQEGLYAEQIEGDLDGAIKIYEKVVTEAKELEQAAAQAMYRIGICYVKKGDKAKAAEYFGTLISEHAKQEALVAKAREQLAKLGISQPGPPDLILADELVRSGTVPAFKAKIFDNSLLDLEKGTLLTEPARTDKTLEHYDVAWDNDGGGALMVVPGSPARILALPAADGWEQAITSARSAVSLLRESTSKGLFGSQSKFAAVLTDAGNLAVIEIGGHDSKQATLSWWLEPVLAHQVKANLYEHLSPDVIQFIGNKYGSICAEAGAKNLYSNSHIYYVTPSFVLMKAGMGYYHNISDRALFNKVRLSGTSSPNQTHYDIAGRRMNTEIVPDEVRRNFYHIYWTPHEPVPPGQMFYYGWCIDQSKHLRSAPGTGHYALEMQNKFGSRVRETFFLALPKATTITSRTEDFTGKDTVGEYDVYYWSKEVPPNTNNVVNISLTTPAFSAPREVTLPIILHARADVDLDVEPDKYVAFDFDRGAILNIPQGVMQKASGGGIDMALKAGIDAVAVVGPNEAGLLGVGIVVQKLPLKAWDAIRPDDLKIVADKQWRKDREQTVTSTDTQRSHPIYAFKTAQGGLGIVQLLQTDKENLIVKFRYAMLAKAFLDKGGPGQTAGPGAAAYLLPALKGLMAGVFNAIENNDTDTAVVLLDKLIADSKKLAQSLKGTSAEAGVVSGIGTLEMLREALANKQMDRAKSLLSAINQMGPGLEDAVEKEAVESRPEMTPAQEQPDKD